MIGDRNGKLDALKDRQWDVVIDNPTTLPAWVRDAAQILKGNVERYCLISTISVYGEVKPGPDENAPAEKYEGADAMKETLEAMKVGGYKTYGPLKALSEKEAEKWFPGKALIIRPGLIVGPRDETDRFTYWPVRIDRGGEVLAPGSPTIRCNSSMRATWRNGRSGWSRTAQPGFTMRLGRRNPSNIGGMLEGIKTALDRRRLLPGWRRIFSKRQKVSPWSDMPVWVPGGRRWRNSTGEHQTRAEQRADFPAAGRDSARHAGVVQAQPKERQEKLKAGLTPKSGKTEVLAAWKKQKSVSGCLCRRVFTRRRPQKANDLQSRAHLPRQKRRRSP